MEPEPNKQTPLDPEQTTETRQSPGDDPLAMTRGAGPARGRLRRVLYGGRYLDESQVQNLLETQEEVGGSLYENLCRQQDLAPIDRAAFFCDLFEGLAYFDVSGYSVPSHLLNVISRKLAEKHIFVPLAQVEGVLTVAMSNPLDLATLDEVSRRTECDVVPVISTDEQIQQAIEQNYQKLEAQKQAQVRLKRHAASEEEMQAAIEETKQGAPGAKGGSEAKEETVVRLVELILNNAIARGASDIHLEPYEKVFRLRYRQDGRLAPVLEGDHQVYPPLVSRLKIMSNLDIAEHRIPQDGRMKLDYEGRDIDFRVSVLPTQHGEKVVMRILDKSSLQLDFTDMGFEENARDTFLEEISKPNGIVLVTGPTGSGKSTTLYSALNNLNRDDVNLITLEDPVEYNIFGINQVQCNAKVGLTFASGLRSILRQDPDVVMVGEIRDHETADIAIKAALTGHLVLSTLHTNDAPGAVSRLLDMGVEPFMLSASLNLAQAQRLVRRVCQRCKKPVKIPQTFLDKHADELPEGSENAQHTYQGEGCEQCNGTGYKGRTCVAEMMPVTPTVKAMIAEGANISDLRDKARQEGMATLFECGLRKAFAGITSLEEIIRVTSM
ncbi:MAG: GspE/PulE family protein [Planctomycetota bacterium]